jgi:CRP/FNR family transcriptional regulator, cyclic AMP receptor protein
VYFPANAPDRSFLENGTMRTTSNTASAQAPISVMAALRRYPSSGIGLVKRKKLKTDFNPEAFLAKTGVGRTIIELVTNECAFSQGELADAIFYIQKGRVKLTVVSHQGKEATIALLGAGDFMGEDSIISGHSTRMATATAITPCTILRIHKAEMVRALHQEHTLSDLFVAFLLTRNARIQEDLVDQLFNSSEKRLARILLLLAHFGKPGKPETVIPKISQETLAEMIGTTRSRVSFFMNRFRKLGFIDYNGSSTDVHSSLLNVILHD